MYKRSYKEQAFHEHEHEHKKIVLSETGSLLEYYNNCQINSLKNKLVVLYLSKKNELVGEEHMREVKDISLLYTNILNCILSYKAEKIIILRAERAQNVIPNKRDTLCFMKLKTLLNLVNIELADYLILSNNSYHSFALHSNVRTYI